MKSHQSNMHFLVLGLAAFATLIVAFHWAWNVAMPTLFGLPPTEFQQTIGLVVLLLVSSVLLGFHHRGSHVSGWNRRRDTSEHEE